MPALSERTLVLEGFTEMQHAVALMRKHASRGFRDQLVRVAEPIRVGSERRAATEIRNLAPSDPWTQMRVGLTKSLVYVAPKQRGRLSRSNPRLRRPNLAALLMERAMQPALRAGADRAEREFVKVLDDLGKDWRGV